MQNTNNQFGKCMQIIRTTVYFSSVLHCRVYVSLTCVEKQCSFRNKAVTRKRARLYTYLNVILKRNRPPEWGEDAIVDWVADWKGLQNSFCGILPVQLSSSRHASTAASTLSFSRSWKQSVPFDLRAVTYCFNTKLHSNQSRVLGWGVVCFGTNLAKFQRKLKIQGLVNVSGVSSQKTVLSLDTVIRISSTNMCI